MRRASFVASAMLALSATAPLAAAQPFVEAQRAPPHYVIGPSTVAARARPARPTAAKREAPPREALAAANRAARRRPGQAGFAGATHVYAYEPGAIFELHTAPERVSTILLEAGEALIDIAAGDTASWMVERSVSGAGPDSRAVVFVKPKSADLKTNLVLVTNRRTYMIEAISGSGEAYSAQVAWRYPAPLRVAAYATAVAAPRTFNYAYRIRTIRGRRPVWSPACAYDDGYRTWIEFPETIAASDMPPLFVRTREGAELVNYRVQGKSYMVDRIFDAAELRLGRASPVVVRIERRPRRSRPDQAEGRS